MATVLTVSELTKEIKQTLEDKFDQVSVEGEISNFKAHISGHWYFSLKDANASISCAMWKGFNNYVIFTPQDGMKVIINGKITVYPPRGNYQIDVRSMKPAGVGELQAAFEALKQKLSDEGLFNEEFKKPIPTFPKKIGIVTAIDGAAFKDMISVAKRRFPLVELVIAPTRVQGAGAAEMIVKSIELLNKHKEIDIIIVGRGGGSIEDLWAFNEEIVARAIFTSEIPIISGVGHEIDFTIADFVADMRAPTPSAAAELAVMDKRELAGILLSYNNRILAAINVKIENIKQRLLNYKKSYGFKRSPDLIHQYAQRVDELNMRRINSYKLYYNHQLEKVNHIQQIMASLNPENILSRGYSITLHEGQLIKSIATLKKGQAITTRLKDGSIESTINELISERSK